MTEDELCLAMLELLHSDSGAFFRTSWRLRPVLWRSVFPNLLTYYGVDTFARDLAALPSLEAALFITVNDRGERQASRISRPRELDGATEGDRSLVLQALKLSPELITRVKPWQMFKHLHSGLLDFLFPYSSAELFGGAIVSAVDFFCTYGETSSGGHYDTGDVFYFVLEGCKEWTVELEPRSASLGDISKHGTAHLVDMSPTGEYSRFDLYPGDCLYVPPYTFHRVRSHGRSLAVSIGLPSPTAIDLFKAALAISERRSQAYQPLPMLPAAYVESQSGTREALRKLLLEHAEDAIDEILSRLT